MATPPERARNALRAALAPDAGHSLSAWLFLRGMGLVFVAAFLSLAVQVEGLLGQDGVLPAADFLERVRAALGGAEAVARLPTVFWLGAGDGALVAACWLGAAAGALLLLDVAPAAMAGLAWALYVSIVNVGQEFLGYQWDGLLLEAGLLAVFVAPWRLAPRLAPRDEGPPRLALWLVRWLLARLMLAAGACKLASGDGAWRSLAALDYHYWTQPLPTWTAWHAHHSPEWLRRASVAVMFLIECGAPLLIPLGRRPRALACGALVGLQALIAATGNYGFFNLLSIVLCVTLLDDGMLGRHVEIGILATENTVFSVAKNLRRVVLCAVTIPIALYSPPLLLSSCGVNIDVPGAALVHPIHLVNRYGLFAVMTTARDEIVIEGSADGETWLPYEFRWKPGDPARAPAFCAPHMPRLDWQMWFAALAGSHRRAPYVLALMARLLEGKAAVRGLLLRDPFPGAPPRQIVARVYSYRFATAEERARDGAWWRREERGLFTPILSLRRP